MIANSVKDKMIGDIFQNAKHINIELMKYAMELLDKEDARKQKEQDRINKAKLKGL
jgi:hypothetical protein